MSTGGTTPTQELLQWATKRREETAAALAERVAAETARQEDLALAEQKLKEIEAAQGPAQAELTRLGPTNEAASNRVKALGEEQTNARTALSQARALANQATVDRKAAEAVHKSRVDSFQELMNAVHPRFSFTLGRAITWAFSGDRWPQFLTSLVVLMSMWFVWLSMSPDIAKTEFARGMITLLFGVGTIIIALILTLTAILQAGLTAEERFKYGMQVLTVLMGVFGTILGFYFGAATRTDGTPPGISSPAQADAKAKADADTKTKADAKAKADADAKTKAEAPKK